MELGGHCIYEGLLSWSLLSVYRHQGVLQGGVRSLLGNPKSTAEIYVCRRQVGSWNDLLLELLTRSKSTKLDLEGFVTRTIGLDAIYETLELVRDDLRKAGGPVRWLRKIKRTAADNVAPLKSAALIVSKLVETISAQHQP